jgi:hypothetical protein
MILGEAWFYALAFVVTAGLLFSSVYFVACIPVAGYWSFVSSKEGVFWIAAVGRVRMKKKKTKSQKNQRRASFITDAQFIVYRSEQTGVVNFAVFIIIIFCCLGTCCSLILELS